MPRQQFGIPALAVRFVLAAWFLAVFALPQPASACSCAQTQQSLAVTVSQTDAVFAGKVTAVADRNSGVNLIDRLSRLLGLPRSIFYSYGRTVTFAVTDSWKGVTKTPVQVTTGYGGADCGAYFSVGHDYLVYAYDSSSDLVTNMCMRTMELALAGADLAYLKTQPQLPLSSSGPSLLAPIVCLGAGLSAAALVVLVRSLAYRRRSAGL